MCCGSSHIQVLLYYHRTYINRLCKSKIKRAQKYLVYVPDSFILVVVGILLAKFLDLQKEGVGILGENKAGS